MSTKITKQIRINNEGGEAFNALVDPGLIKKWWEASQAIVVPDENGVYAVTWGNPDAPESVLSARISEYKPHVKLSLTEYKRYTPGNDYNAGTQVNFIIECYTSYCLLTLEHRGFSENPESHEFYENHKKDWEKTLKSLKEVVESKGVSVN